MTLIGTVQKQVKPREYYADVFVETEDTDRWPDTGEIRVKCCFHPDSRPSLYCNLESGAWYCHGCALGGKTIVSFDALLNKCSHDDSAEALFHYYIHPVIPINDVERWHKELFDVPSFLSYLRHDRALSSETIVRHTIGATGDRIAIPIYNEYGLCVNAKLYDPRKNRGKMPKMVSYKDEQNPEAKYGTPSMLYPLSAMSLAKSLGWVVVCEGEWDALALLSMGVPAVTGTSGCKSWPDQYNHLFHGLVVGIAYDNDEDGVKYARVPAHALTDTAREIHRVTIPKKFGKDVTDQLLTDDTSRSVEYWKNLVYTSKTWSKNEQPRPIEPIVGVEDIISLDQATAPQYARKTIGIDCMVSGKGVAPYHLPRRYRAYCGRICEACPLRESDIDFTEITIERDDPFLLELADSNKSTVRALLLRHAKISPKPECFGRIEELESVSIEQLLLIPTLDSMAREYVTRTGYYVGHGLRSNSGYRMTGATIPHPRGQQATHLFTKAKPLRDEIESFHLTPLLKKSLQIFRPPDGVTVVDHLHTIAQWQSTEITKIRERNDLHIGIDLVFHSVRSFSFNGEYIRRGMLDVLVIGDTRCGKGFVAEGLVRYYGLGEVASGENCSFAGLVGGVQHISNRWFVTWGLVPLNNNRVVVIDEASALSESDIGHMSRVRSEGVAEISKIVRETTQANTRLIWLANPRSGLPIASYNTGVESIKELIGANEDISRFDYAISVATDEVAPEIINTTFHGNGHDSTGYSSDLCRALVLWAWSRKAEEVTFSGRATSAIITAAIDLGKKYSPTIPLVQSENIRIKLAKISAAIAARCFSTDAECERLLVREVHAIAAIELLCLFYDKPSMGYDRFSSRAIATSTIANVEKITRILENTGANQSRLVDGLLNLHKITTYNLADYVGGDLIIARTLVSDLVMENCLKLENDRSQSYLKNPAFREWLKRYRPTIKK